MTTTDQAIAAIDIGTNSVHLVIARRTETGTPEVITREKAPVRLGSGGRVSVRFVNARRPDKIRIEQGLTGTLSWRVHLCHPEPSTLVLGLKKF